MRSSVHMDRLQPNFFIISICHPASHSGSHSGCFIIRTCEINTLSCHAGIDTRDASRPSEAGVRVLPAPEETL
jgi:hypothetical protein